MRWIVEGADRFSGEARKMSVSADSRTDAERIAHVQGMMVSEVRADPPPPEAPEPPPRPVVPVAAPAAPTDPPAYVGLRFAGAFLRALAILAWGTVAIVTLIVILYSDSPSPPFRTTPELAALALTLFLFGGLYLALGSACEALRDIARNSFR